MAEHPPKYHFAQSLAGLVNLGPLRLKHHFTSQHTGGPSTGLHAAFLLTHSGLSTVTLDPWDTTTYLPFPFRVSLGKAGKVRRSWTEKWPAARRMGRGSRRQGGGVVGVVEQRAWL